MNCKRCGHFIALIQPNKGLNTIQCYICGHINIIEQVPFDFLWGNFEEKKYTIEYKGVTYVKHYGSLKPESLKQTIRNAVLEQQKRPFKHILITEDGMFFIGNNGRLGKIKPFFRKQHKKKVLPACCIRCVDCQAVINDMAKCMRYQKDPQRSLMSYKFASLQRLQDCPLID